MIKYLWSAAGYGLIAVPLLITRKRHRSRVEHAGAERSKQKGDADGIVAARTESTSLGSVFLAQWKLMNRGSLHF